LQSQLFEPGNVAAKVALNRKVQGGDSSNTSGVPSHGIAQQCCLREAFLYVSAQGLLGWRTFQA